MPLYTCICAYFSMFLFLFILVITCYHLSQSRMFTGLFVVTSSDNNYCLLSLFTDNKSA